MTDIANQDADAYGAMSFAMLKEELQGISVKLSSSEVTLEEISDLVAKARVIVEICKSRIELTRAEVDAILHQEV